MDVDNQWSPSYSKKFRHKNNKQFVTARCNNKCKTSLCMRIAIGVDVCELVGFKKGDKVNIFLHKENENFLAIKKNCLGLYGHKLSYCESVTGNSSFMTFELRWKKKESFRISQTIVLDYDFNEEHLLIVDLSKVRRGI